MSYEKLKELIVQEMKKVIPKEQLANLNPNDYQIDISPAPNEDNVASTAFKPVIVNIKILNQTLIDQTKLEKLIANFIEKCNEQAKLKRIANLEQKGTQPASPVKLKVPFKIVKYTITTEPAAKAMLVSPSKSLPATPKKTSTTETIFAILSELNPLLHIKERSDVKISVRANIATVTVSQQINTDGIKQKIAKTPALNGISVSINKINHFDKAKTANDRLAEMKVKINTILEQEIMRLQKCWFHPKLLNLKINTLQDMQATIKNAQDDSTIYAIMYDINKDERFKAEAPKCSRGSGLTLTYNYDAILNKHRHGCFINTDTHNHLVAGFAELAPPSL